MFSSQAALAAPLALVRGPTAIDWQGHAGDRGGGGACEKDGKGAQLFDGGEALVGLLREQHIADHLLARDIVRFGLSVDLRLHERRVNIAWTDRVAGDALLSGLKRGYLGE